MGILKTLGDFFFGKNPDIFDDKGQVLHRHPKKKWDRWQNRYKNDPNFNWRHHSGLGTQGLQQEEKTRSH
jgi:hypothetical protein